MAYRRKDRPNEGYRIAITLPKPWGKVGPWASGFHTKRDAQRVEMWLFNQALSRPALIDALVAKKLTLRDAWAARNTPDDTRSPAMHQTIAHPQPAQPSGDRIDRRARVDTAERFWPHVGVKNGVGCWNWFGPRDSQGRRTFEWRDGTHVTPQEASWLLHFGEVPAGALVLTECGHAACVRPSHLMMRPAGRESELETP